MNEFVITSPQGVRCKFHSRTCDAGGRLETFAFEVEELDFTASMQIFAGLLQPPPSALFDRLAFQWQGWKGVEAWTSAEGEFSITATSDRTGHVHLAFNLLKPAQSAYWTPSAFVMVDAGHLEPIARDARRFFGTDSRTAAP